MTIYTIASISDTFSKFLQNGNYESAILNLMNTSTKVFPSVYEHVDSQSNGECDFIDVRTKEKFDVKLPFDKTEGRLICSNNADLIKWLEFMINEAAECRKCLIKNRGVCNVEDLRLYKTIDKRLASIKQDENGIFFFPYPITYDGEELIHLQFASDILSAIFRALNEQGKVLERNIYVIYPSMDGTITLRLLNTGAREFIYSEEIQKHISFNFSL